MPKYETVGYRCDDCGCDIPTDRVNTVEGEVDFDGIRGGMTTHISITKNGKEQFLCPNCTLRIVSAQVKKDIEDRLKTDELYK